MIRNLRSTLVLGAALSALSAGASAAEKLTL